MGFEIILPWPPSANRLWRATMRVPKNSKTGKRVPSQCLSEAAKAFYEDVKGALYLQMRAPFPQVAGRVAVELRLSAPDGRLYDTDNRVKAAFDALQKLALLANDSQIDVHTVVRCKPGHGKIRAIVREITGELEDM
jgi:Holliday junction resolvase RusA-like endonuclease